MSYSRYSRGRGVHCAVSWRLWTLLILSFILLIPGQAFGEEQPYVYITDHKGHWAEASIQEFVDMGITRGYPDGTFRPDAPISRAEFLALVARAFDLKVGPEDTPFPDVTPQDWFRPEVSAAKAAGIVGGYPDGRFMPQKPVTRVEIVAMVIRAAQNSLLETKEARSFPDVDPNSWMAEPVTRGVKTGIVSGYDDGRFYPEKGASRAEAVAILIRVLNELKAEASSPPEALLSQTVMAFENAGIEEMNRADYSLAKSLEYTIGLARETTLFQGEQLANRAASGAKLTIAPVSQKAEVIERRQLTAKVRYQFTYRVTVTAPGVEQTGTHSDSVIYTLRIKGGAWKIYKMEAQPKQ